MKEKANEREASASKLAGLLGIARRAGKLITGFDAAAASAAAVAVDFPAAAAADLAADPHKCTMFAALPLGESRFFAALGHTRPGRFIE